MIRWPVSKGKEFSTIKTYSNWRSSSENFHAFLQKTMWKGCFQKVKNIFLKVVLLLNLADYPNRQNDESFLIPWYSNKNIYKIYTFTKIFKLQRIKGIS